MKKRIGVAGFGVTGQALVKYLVNNTKHNVYILDPPKNLRPSLEDREIVFICVPVPTAQYQQDLSMIHDVMGKIPETATVFVRSTVLPGTVDRLNDQYPNDIYAMPEFLTARRSYEDMEALDIVTGCGDRALLESLFPGKKFHVMANAEAEMTKFCHNACGATKVIFFNIFYEMCRRLRLDFETVRKATLHTGHINAEHTRVPGPDGSLGYGGTCYPPNMTALTGFLAANDMADEFNFIKAAVNLNDKYRHGVEYHRV